MISRCLKNTQPYKYKEESYCSPKILNVDVGESGVELGIPDLVMPTMLDSVVMYSLYE